LAELQHLRFTRPGIKGNLGPPRISSAGAANGCSGSNTCDCGIRDTSGVFFLRRCEGKKEGRKEDVRKGERTNGRKDGRKKGREEDVRNGERTNGRKDDGGRKEEIYRKVRELTPTIFEEIGRRMERVLRKEGRKKGRKEERNEGRKEGY
jgi:hypothetical protein